MVITDNGRNFAFITGAVFAAILSMVTLIIGKVVELIRKKKNYTQQRV
jgi:hypothetical protein